MATLYWLGATADFTSTSNWSTSRKGSSGAGPPADGDTVFIIDGTGDITGNLDNTGVDLVGLTIGGEFTGGIGAAGSALTIGVSGNGGGGTYYCRINYKGSNTINLAAGSDTIDELHVTRPNGSAGAFRLNLTGGTTTLMYVGRGVNLYAEDGAVVTTAEFAGGFGRFGYNATAITALTVGGGAVVQARRAITTFTGDQATVGTENIATIGTLNARNGCNLTHDSTGTITLVNGYPGSNCYAASSPFTVTNATVREGARVFENNPSLVTRTNAFVNIP